MGWGSGTNYKGEAVGYSVEDVCNEPGCDTKIDRGLSYCCGGLEGVFGGNGCGDYFCEDHLYFSNNEDNHDWLCIECVALEDKESEEGV